MWPPTMRSTPAAAISSAIARMGGACSAISLATLPHWITYDAGLYAEEGLDVGRRHAAPRAQALGDAARLLVGGEVHGLELRTAQHLHVRVGDRRDLFGVAPSPLQDAEFALFEGNSAVVPTEFDGIRAQMLAGVASGTPSPWGASAGAPFAR